MLHLQWTASRDPPPLTAQLTLQNREVILGERPRFRAHHVTVTIHNRRHNNEFMIIFTHPIHVRPRVVAFLRTPAEIVLLFRCNPEQQEEQYHPVGDTEQDQDMEQQQQQPAPQPQPQPRPRRQQQISVTTRRVMQLLPPFRGASYGVLQPHPHQRQQDLEEAYRQRDQPFQRRHLPRHQ